MSVFAAALSVIALVVAAITVAVANNKDSGSSSSAGGGGGASNISVTLSEFAISPATINAAPGNVVLQVSNAGSIAHNLTVKDLKATADLEAGHTATLDLGSLSAGTYDVYCSIPGHQQAGMTGKLVVAAGASSSGSASSGGGTTASGDLQQLTDDQMNTLMEDVAKAFPAKTKGIGGDDAPLEPKVLSDGTKEFDLVAKVVDWEVQPGKIVKAWTYNGVVPAPTIKVGLNEKVKFVLKNELPQSTSLHFHGVDVPNSMDGVDPYTQPPIKPGDTFTYEFTTPNRVQVGMYHSHHNAQVQVPNGMSGALLIGEVPLPDNIGVSKITKEITMSLSDAGTIGLGLNGKSFPATKPYTLRSGESMLVHYFNEGLLGHPMHLHQPMGWIIAKDGIPLKDPVPGDTFWVAPGERLSVVYTAEKPGVWAWHCHILNHAETPRGMTGMVTALIVEN